MRKITYKDVSPEMQRMAAPNFSEDRRSSIGMEQFMGEYFFIDVQKLLPYRNQARKIFDEEEIQKLSETIKEHGIRQPLTVLRSSMKDGMFEVVSGERRLRAAKLIGLQKVPCIIIEDRDKADEIALIENIQRENLHPIELARAVSQLISRGGHGNQSDIGRKIGMSRSQMSETLKLLELGDSLLDLMLLHDVRGREHYRKLLSLDNEEDRLKHLQKILQTDSQVVPDRPLLSRSVLRITLDEKGVGVQRSKMRNLTSSQTKEVIRVLEEIIETLRRS
jgi:ParB family chromosome partitioning protein